MEDMLDKLKEVENRLKRNRFDREHNDNERQYRFEKKITDISHDDIMCEGINDKRILDLLLEIRYLLRKVVIDIEELKN